MTALTDQGIHKNEIDLQEDDLKANGWRPLAKHAHSVFWYSPDGVLTPGIGYAHSVMLANKNKV